MCNAMAEATDSSRFTSLSSDQLEATSAPSTYATSLSKLRCVLGQHTVGNIIKLQAVEDLVPRLTSQKARNCEAWRRGPILGYSVNNGSLLP